MHCVFVFVAVRVRGRATRSRPDPTDALQLPTILSSPASSCTRTPDAHAHEGGDFSGPTPHDRDVTAGAAHPGSRGRRRRMSISTDRLAVLHSPSFRRPTSPTTAGATLLVRPAATVPPVCARPSPRHPMSTLNPPLPCCAIAATWRAWDLPARHRLPWPLGARAIPQPPERAGLLHGKRHCDAPGRRLRTGRRRPSIPKQKGAPRPARLPPGIAPYLPGTWSPRHTKDTADHA